MKLIPISNYSQDLYSIFTIVDEEDYELASSRYWYLTTGYAMSYTYANKKKTYKSLHRLLLEDQLTDPALVVDHINYNKLDNRRSNLRAVSRSINNLNRSAGMVSTGKKRKYRGVSYEEKKAGDKKWKATLRKDVLGYYSTELEAMQAVKDTLEKALAV